MKRSISQIREELRKKPIERSFTIERDAAVDENTRTVNVAFASDSPVDHWFGELTLEVTSKAMRSERLLNGAAVLLEHNRSQQIGVVENFTIKGGVARADIRFDTDPLSEQIWQSVKNGIRRNISVGFMLHEMHLVKEGTKDAAPLYGSIDWEPFEISIVSVPADTNAGVGRELSLVRDDTKDDTPNEEGDMCPDCENPIDECTCEANSSRALNRAISTQRTTNMTPEEIAAQAAANNTGAPATERSAEVVAAERASAIMDFASIFGEQGTTIARTMLAASDAVTLDDVRTAIRAAQPPSTVVPPMDPQTAAERGGAPQQHVQLARSIYRGGKLKAFKGEKAEERAYRAGQFFAASLSGDARAMQFCRDNGIVIERAHGGGTNSLGGFLVPDEIDSAIIDLRLQYGVFRSNANVVPMASDTKSKNRRTGGLTAYHRGSGQAVTESTKSWDQVQLVAKLVSVLTKYENEFGEDASINVADDLVDEIAFAFAQAEDNDGFNGDGTSTYGGIVGIRNKILNLSATRADIAGLQVASGNAWSEIVIGDLLGVVGKLPSFARKTGNVKWYCSSEFWATVLQRLALAGGGVTHAEFEGELKESFLGKPVEITEAMPHTEANDVVPLLYGNLAMGAMLGDRKGTSIDMTNSDSTDFAKGVQAIRGDTRYDINVHDVGNATSVAADKRPGPIVGLLAATS